MEEKEEEKNNLNIGENKEVKKENKKIITSFEFKSFIDEVLNKNIFYSEDNNNINFISLELLISKINDNNLNETNKNINYKDILLYITYQKNSIMTTEIFLDIINSYMKANNINTAIYLLNSYLLNYYTTEILPSRDIMNTVIGLYKLSNKQKITFHLIYDKDKEIDINKLIEYITAGKKDKINYLGGMETIRQLSDSKESIIPEVTDKIFDIFCWDPVEIARQITIFTQYLYRNIGCQELVSAGWTKSDKMEKAPNISKLIVRFNNISRWIMEEILSYDSSKDRAKVIEIFISVADELRNMHNLNDCFAVITTFNHLCIKRLKRTWEKVNDCTKNKQKELSNLCSILKNFENIKNEFLEYKNSVKDINEVQEGCIPYLAPYLKDLAFLEEGHKYLNENKLINIQKIIFVGKIIKNIKDSQMFVYSYKPVYCLSILSDPEPLGDDELTELSEHLEPRFKLNTKKTKIKRKTKTEIKFEKIKSGLSPLFVEYIKDYSSMISKKMTLSERIKLFQTDFTSINDVRTSNPVIRSLNLSSTIDEGYRLSTMI